MRKNGAAAEGTGDRELWQLSATADPPDNDEERLLDLAGFADGLLDEDDEARVAEWLARDPLSAEDVAAARAAPAVEPLPDMLSDRMIARACALVPESAVVVPFPPQRPRVRAPLFGMAQWGSLAAAVVLAGWLGFTLGMDTSKSLNPTATTGQAGEEGFLHEILDPSTGFVQDLTGSTQT